ncbi:MAG: fumarylacetoacetate hydrolase family protein [Chloroflexota bacterium]|nr:fumarylacetoacetate hydrolase family protein [Chloroflexota bacterium]
MRIVRFRDGSSDHWGIAREGFVHHMPEAPFWFGDDGEVVGPIDSVEMLVPVQPGKIVCVGLNYAKHVTERDATRKIPTEPVLFMKPPSALIKNGEPIQIAHPDHETHHEAELVVVMGRRAEHVDAAESLEYVLGYTCGNDVSDRDLQAQDGQFVRAKGFNTYCPIGPWIETQIDPRKLKISATVNGEVRQNSTTANMLFPVDVLVSFISGVMTLEPGDIIMTGTPEGVGPLRNGDTCAISIERIGTLENPVRNR